MLGTIIHALRPALLFTLLAGLTACQSQYEKPPDLETWHFHSRRTSKTGKTQAVLEATPGGMRIADGVRIQGQVLPEYQEQIWNIYRVHRLWYAGL